MAITQGELEQAAQGLKDHFYVAKAAQQRTAPASAAAAGGIGGTPPKVRQGGTWLCECRVALSSE